MKRTYVQICENIKRLAEDLQQAGESNNEELIYLKLKEIKNTVENALDKIDRELDG